MRKAMLLAALLGVSGTNTIAETQAKTVRAPMSLPFGPSNPCSTAPRRSARRTCRPSPDPEGASSGDERPDCSCLREGQPLQPPRRTGTRAATPSRRRGPQRGGPGPPRCPIPRRNQVASRIALSLASFGSSHGPTARWPLPGAVTSFQVEAPDADQVVLAVELMGVERVRSCVGPFAGGEGEALVVVGGDLVALLPVGSEPAKVGQKHLRLAGDIGAHVPGGGLG